MRFVEPNKQIEPYLFMTRGMHMSMQSRSGSNNCTNPTLKMRLVEKKAKHKIMNEMKQACQFVVLLLFLKTANPSLPVQKFRFRAMCKRFLTGKDSEKFTKAKK